MLCRQPWPGGSSGPVFSNIHFQECLGRLLMHEVVSILGVVTMGCSPHPSEAVGLLSRTSGLL